MKTKPIEEAPDSAEIDALKELERSPGYQLVVNRIAEMILRRCFELEGELDEPKTNRIRGEIKALRDVLTIPEVLKGEIQQQLQKQK